VAHARTPGASAGVTNDPPLSFVFRRRADSSHPSGSSVEVRTPRPGLNQRGGHVANSNLGNEILRPETFDLTRPQWAAETVEWTWQTDFRGRKSRKCRAVLRRRKSRRFARTSWWRTQSRQTGLRYRARQGIVKSIPLVRFLAILRLQNAAFGLKI
jgi:hypothetical protein